MSSARRGSIPADGVVDLLRELENHRASGLLVFSDASGSRGEVFLRLGQLDSAQDEQADGSDPVERFLAARGGTYEIVDQLPKLEGTVGSATERRGSLERHTVADVMSYAAGVALTGVVRVESEGRAAEIVYEDGVLATIYLDGEEREPEALFGWEQGEFIVRLHTTASLVPPAGPEPRVVERPLASLLDDAAQRRVRPPHAPPPRIRTLGPPPREATVRIVMLGGRGEALLKLTPRPGTIMPLPGASTAPPVARVASRAVVGRPGLPRTGERRSPRSVQTHEVEPEPIVPHVVTAILVLLLVLGMSAFVASLLAIG